MLEQRHTQINTGEEARFREYLDALQKPMATLGEAAQEEWRAEAESHLQCLIAAYEELGETREAAIRLALRRFGTEPATTGRNVCRATIRSAPDTSLLQAAARALSFFAMPTFVGLGVLGILAVIYVQSGQLLALDLLQKMSFACFILIPIVAGCKIGAWIPRWRACSEQDSLLRSLQVESYLLLPMALMVAAEMMWGGIFSGLSQSLAGHSDVHRFWYGLYWAPMTLTACILRIVWSRHRGNDRAAMAE